MTSVIQVIASLPSERPIFKADGRLVTAGQIRGTARRISSMLRAANEMCLYTNSASLFAAGLVAAAQSRVTLSLPAHIRPAYLSELNGNDSVLLTDCCDAPPSALRIALARETADEEPLIGFATELDMAFYTSGSTGRPKRISKRLWQLEVEAEILENLWGQTAGPVQSTVSHQHIYGMLFRVVWPVLSGRISADYPTFHCGRLLSELETGATLVLSPAHLERLPPATAVRHPEPGLVFSSGAPLSYEAAQNARDHFGSLPIEVFGSTETGGIAWRQQIRPKADWIPLPGVQVEIGEGCELQISSPQSGFCTPTATGDKARATGCGFSLHGRLDRVAKVEGKRVSLVRVEESLENHPAIRAVAVVWVQQPTPGLGAIVELSQLGEDAFAEIGSFRLSRKLRRDVSSLLEAAEIPKYWRFRSLPLDSQGKRIESALKQLFELPPVNRFGIGTVTDLRPDNAAIRIQLDPEMTWFEGHFPGEPILPGVAQVHMACLWAEHLWGWQPEHNSLNLLKFRRVLRAGNEVLLTLSRNTQASRLTFAFHLNGEVVSGGSIGGCD